MARLGSETEVCVLLFLLKESSLPFKMLEPLFLSKADQPLQTILILIDLDHPSESLYLCSIQTHKLKS